MTSLRHINEIRMRYQNFTLLTGYISMPGGHEKVQGFAEHAIRESLSCACSQGWALTGLAVVPNATAAGRAGSRSNSDPAAIAGVLTKDLHVRDPLEAYDCTTPILRLSPEC